MKSLIIINDGPDGSERCHDALRVAHALLEREDAEVGVFLMADAVTAAVPGQNTPEGHYNIERMLKRVILGKGRVMLSGTCMDARGLREDAIVEGATVSNMAELADLIAAADSTQAF